MNLSERIVLNNREFRPSFHKTGDKFYEGIYPSELTIRYSMLASNGKTIRMMHGKFRHYGLLS